MPRSLRQLVAGFVLLLAGASAFGQAAGGNSSSGKPGSIHGTITSKQDNASAAVPGVTITLTPEPGSSKPLTADTDESGQYEFKGLKPGSYTISITLAGFKAVKKAVGLHPGETVVVDLRLELETITEKVEVQEENQTISTESSVAPSETIGHRELISLPTPQEKIKEVLTFTPGVVKTSDGKLNFKGADENQSLLLVNSARTSDPVTGSFSIPIPTDAVQSFAVYKTPYNAGLGSFSGGLTTVETKPPTDQWNFNVKNFIPSVLGKNGHMVGLAEALPGVTFGGPLGTSKLLFSEVFQYEMKKRTVRGLPWPNDISKKQGFNSFSTVEAILSPKDLLTLTVNAFPLRQQHIDINALVPETAGNDLNQKGVAVGVADRYQFGSGASLSAVVQYTRFDSNAHGQGFDDMLISPEGWGGSYFNQWTRRGKEFQFLPSFQFSEREWHGRHEIHAGMDVNYRSYFGNSTADPIRLLREDGTLAEQIDFQGAPVQLASDTSVAEFFQDHWILDPHWSMDLGARVSSETHGWSGAFSPRLGLAYSPHQDGKTVIRAGAGLFYSVLPLLAGDFGANPTRMVIQFDATGQPMGLPTTYTNVFVGNANPLSSSALPLQPGTTPRNFTWNVEADHELPKHVVVRVGYIDSHTTYLFVVNPFQGAAGANSFLGLANNGSSHYREVESTVHFRVRGRHEVNASYIWSRTRGDLNNLSSVMIPFSQPVIVPNVYGILPYDVPHRFITWGVFQLPRRFTFSPVVDVRSGRPYSDVDVQQNYVGTPNGQRFDPFFSLDMKLYREFHVPFLGSHSGKQHHIRLGFYSLNVTNHGNFHDVYNNVTSPRFGEFAGFLDRREGAVIDFVD